MKMNNTEKGQALVIIVLAAVVLFGFAALAIDGSMVFSDRRHAQNAADTAALAGALAIVRGDDYNAAALSRASGNGYNNNPTTNVVEVYNPPIDGNYAGNNEYIQVKITSHVKTTFARVLGTSEIINHVQAVAHATQAKIEPLFSGQAIVALGKTDCPGLKAAGGGTTTVTGSGIFVNSSGCSSSPASFDIANNSSMSVPCWDVVGTVTGSVTTSGSCSNIHGQQISDYASTYPTPNIPCDTSHAASYTSTVLNPGYYTGSTFPPTSGAATMMPGVYCINVTNGFNLSGSKTLTGSGVLIYMMQGGINWNTDSTLSAISDSSNPYSGLLIVMATSNSSDVSIQGNGSATYTGTILAPLSQVKLAGSSSSGTTLNNQIIAKNVIVTGGAGLNINFNAGQQWKPPIPATIQMTQ